MNKCIACNHSEHNKEPHFGGYWTTDEEALIKKLVADGLTVSEISDVFREHGYLRTTNAIHQRMYELGL